MLTKLVLDNFKRFGHAEIELGKAVVFIGPNNSRKTSALQALTLWEIGLWWREIKASDDFFDRLFHAFYDKLGLPNLMRKTDYHVLARFLPPEEIDQEVETVLDMIHDVAKRATVPQV